MNKTKKAIKQLLALTLSLVMTLAFLVSISPQAEASPDITASFTDPNFLAAVRELPGVPPTGPILASDVAGITSLILIGKQIQDLAGIEHFVALEELDVFVNELTTLDVSNNLSLTLLDVMNNELTTLDVSSNAALEQLNAGGNQLTTLDVSNNLALEQLDVRGNQLTTLDVSNNQALVTLRLDHNQLTTLDTSNNPALEWLGVGRNQLAALDMSNNPALTRLQGTYNQLTILDVSNNPALTILEVELNQLTMLDVSNNSSLTWLTVMDNQLTTLDVSNNPALEQLAVGHNQLTTLDVSNNPLLKSLHVGFNQLTTLDTSNNPSLEWLSVQSNQLATLNMSNNPSLESLHARSNQLTTLDVSNNPALRVLDVGGNQLTVLDVSSSAALQILHVESNRLTTLDVSNNVVLRLLHVQSNYIISTDMIIGVGNTQLPAIGTDGYPFAFVFNPQNTVAPPLSFAITVVNGTSTTATAAAGTAVTITANTPPSGQRFVNWTSTSAGVVLANANNTSTTFVMPNNAVTVTANFEDIPPYENGQEPPPPPPNEWQPPVPVSELFPDSQNHWAAGVRNPDDTNYIGWAMANDITSGFPDGTFRPNGHVTRAQFTAFLYRIAEGGTPPVRPELEFADMRSTDWHHGYVAWAYSEDIVAGFPSNNTFRPNQQITREQLVLMLFRYAGESVSTDVLGDFHDSGRISSWAREAMNWAAYHELIGRGGTLNPSGNATRAETLAILHRVVDTFNIPAP